MEMVITKTENSDLFTCEIIPPRYRSAGISETRASHDASKREKAGTVPIHVEGWRRDSSVAPFFLSFVEGHPIRLNRQIYARRSENLRVTIDQALSLENYHSQYANVGSKALRTTQDTNSE